MTQGYNRYAYVMNNPLKYTDPSGFMDDPLFLNYNVQGGFQINWNSVFTTGINDGLNQAMNDFSAQLNGGITVNDIFRSQLDPLGINIPVPNITIGTSLADSGYLGGYEGVNASLANQFGYAELANGVFKFDIWFKLKYFLQYEVDINIYRIIGINVLIPGSVKNSFLFHP